jgi:hypothetical protein
MSAIKDYVGQHMMLVCGFAAVLVVVAIIFSIPVLAVFGALMCGAMMIMMVWMMFAMVSKGRH